MILSILKNFDGVTGTVTKDGRTIFNVDCSTMDGDVRAVQWGMDVVDEGWEERNDWTNTNITSIVPYQPVIDDFDQMAYDEDNPPPLSSEDQMAFNSEQAQAKQAEHNQALVEYDALANHGLPLNMDSNNLLEVENNIRFLQGDIDNPTDSDTYTPIDLPTLNPTVAQSFIVTVTRIDVNGTLDGWKAKLDSYAFGFTPTNIGVAWYDTSDTNCQTMLGYTTFIEDSGDYVCQVPVGEELGNIEFKMTITMEPGPLVISTCFTFPVNDNVIDMVMNAY